MEYFLYVWLYTNSGVATLRYDTPSKKECYRVASKMKKDKFILMDNDSKLYFNEIRTECVK